MQIIFEPHAKADLDFFIKSGNKSVLRKITFLIESITESPFEGLGKPEPLNFNYQEPGQGASTKNTASSTKFLIIK